MIRHNASEMEAWLHGIAKQIPYATAAALNSTGFQIRMAEREEIRRAFDTPTPYTLNSVRVRKASVSNPSAMVFINDNARGKGTSPSEYLARQVFGGGREHKVFERLLKTKEFLVPAPGTKLNRFGNLPKGVIKKVTSALDGGDTTKYFRRKGKNGKLSKAVYERRGRGRKKKIRPIMFAVRRPKYNRRFKFFNIGIRVATKRFEANWNREFNRIVVSGGRIGLIPKSRIVRFTEATP